MTTACTCADYYELREGYIVAATRPGCLKHDPDGSRGPLGLPCSKDGVVRELDCALHGKGERE